MEPTLEYSLEPTFEEEEATRSAEISTNSLEPFFEGEPTLEPTDDLFDDLVGADSSYSENSPPFKRQRVDDGLSSEAADTNAGAETPTTSETPTTAAKAEAPTTNVEVSTTNVEAPPTNVEGATAEKPPASAESAAATDRLPLDQSIGHAEDRIALALEHSESVVDSWSPAKFDAYAEEPRAEEPRADEAEADRMSALMPQEDLLQVMLETQAAEWSNPTLSVAAATAPSDASGAAADTAPSAATALSAASGAAADTAPSGASGAAAKSAAPQEPDIAGALGMALSRFGDLDSAREKLDKMSQHHAAKVNGVNFKNEYMRFSRQTVSAFRPLEPELIGRFQEDKMSLFEDWLEANENWGTVLVWEKRRQLQRRAGKRVWRMMSHHDLLKKYNFDHQLVANIENKKRNSSCTAPTKTVPIVRISGCTCAWTTFKYQTSTQAK